MVKKKIQTFHKYTKIKAIGHEDNEDIFKDKKDDIVIEEKIDGANTRFMIRDGIIIFGSRTQELHEDKEHQYAKNFRRAINYISEQTKDINLKSYQGYIFYGEACVPHSLQYDWEKIPPYLLFDIYDLENELFYPLKDIKKFATKLNLSVVPVIKECRAKDIKEITDKDIPKSKYSPGPAEGIVFKNYSKQIFAKYVSDKFKEVNRKTFGGGKKYAKDDTEYLVATYCTNSRIDKIVFKLIDSGEKLDMPLMHKLPNMVYKDIWEENWQEISNFKKTFNLQKLKQMVSKRCLMVLKQIMANNVINKKDKKVKKK